MDIGHATVHVLFFIQFIAGPTSLEHSRSIAHAQCPIAHDEITWNMRDFRFHCRGNILRVQTRRVLQTVVFRYREIGGRLCTKHRKK
jgi:hypothetical protein